MTNKNNFRWLSNDIDNTIQYATSLSDLLQISDFKFDEEPQDFEYNHKQQEF